MRLSPRASRKKSAFRPFCSERCKLIDFGAWADEEFRLPTQETELSEEDVDEIEKALNKKEI
jgi:endogenous inhibitor of DNA gyrase (YacG/DUF329 family)